MKLPIGYPNPDARGRARKRFQGRVYDFGLHGTPESIAAYQAFLHETLAVIGGRPQVERLSVSALIYEWLKYEDGERGRNHPEVERICRACVPLERLFGETWADEFDSLGLIEVQAAMVSGSWMDAGEKKRLPTWSRNYTNKQISRITRLFRWAESRKFVPAGRWHNLLTVEPIKANHRTARINPPRKPVDYQAQVVPILPLLTPQLAAVTQIIYLSAARPGEIVRLRPDEIDRDGPHGCWLYAPKQHKGQWRGHHRVIVFGPKAQSVLASFLLSCPADDAPLFRPHRRTLKPYSDEAYPNAVRRACIAAKVTPWRPYDLRHSRATLVKRTFGLEVAKSILGHSSQSMTERYGESTDVEAAARAMKECG